MPTTINDSGLFDARLVEIYRDVLGVPVVALVAGVVLVLLAQVEVTMLCCWETLRSLPRGEGTAPPKTTTPACPPAR